MLVCALVSVAAYLRAIHFPFILDDTVYISANTKLAGLHLTELWRLFTEPYNGMSEFLPVRELSYWLDIMLFGLNPTAFRMHNILLYLLSLPLIYVVTAWSWRYFRAADSAGTSWAAAAVTALFALHPSHAEAVVWIAGRKDVLSGVFSLLALWLALAVQREQRFSAPHVAATLLALLAAMLSKASAVAVAPVIAIVWVMFWRDMDEPKKRLALLFWPVVALLLAATVALIFSAFVSSARLPFYFGIEAVTRSLAVLGWLARLAFSPETRHFFYPLMEDPFFPLMVAAGAGVVALAIAGAVALARKPTLEGYAVVVFVLLCVPSLQLIPYAPPSMVSDRFVFLAVWPGLLLLVSLAWRLKPLPRWLLLIGIGLAWGIQTIERPRDWRSTEAMIEADVRAYPGYSVPAVYKITIVQLGQGLYREAAETAQSIATPELRDVMLKTIEADYAVRVSATAAGQPQEAMNLLWQLGIEVKQASLSAIMNPHLANIRMRRRMLLDAEWQYLVEHFPDDVSVRYNAGLWMLGMLDAKGAAANLRIAVESKRLPGSVRGAAFNKFGLALLYSGHAAEAEAAFSAALQQTPPDLRAYCGLATLYRQAGQTEDALRAAADCRSSSPSNAAPR